MIGIVDYGMGNLGSVINACRFLDMDARIVTRPVELDACRAMILPGVGAFGDCMEHLASHGFVEASRAWIAADKPFLGICVGLQALFEGSDESPDVAGLGVLRGRVRKFVPTPDYKVPQIGWNRVRYQPSACPLFQGIPDQTFFYYVHSFYAEADEAGVIAGASDYAGVTYTAAVWRNNLMAVQFHPEKSQRWGLQMLKNFGALATKGN
ncbi:MAG: imidazole glycerol phosphate synthase subunit HisH [Verrucomicrobia bacterium]|nr:MAG: imidazole glycerol phosphate synthase subunit HisH [Verrucomicrobiota bacterium]